MTLREKFEYIATHWFLKDGIVCSLQTGDPISSFINETGHLLVSLALKGRRCSTVKLHQAAFMLYHNRPIGEGMIIHHIDGNPLNNHPSNLVELTHSQHRRIHAFQCDDPMLGISLAGNAWRYQWRDDNGRPHTRHFHGINEAMKFRAEIEEPYRAELRALGLDC